MKANYLLPSALAISSGALFCISQNKPASALLLVALVNAYVVWWHAGYALKMFEKSKVMLTVGHGRKLSSPLQKKLASITLRSLIATALLAFILLLAGVRSSLDSKTQLLLGVMLLVAALPVALPLEVIALMHWAAPKRATALTGYAIRIALGAAMALVFIVVAGSVALAGWHTPVALTVLQILVVQLVFQLLAVAALAWEDSTHSSRESWINEAGFSFISASIIYGNFLFFFARNGVSPRYISTNNPYYFRATTLALLTLVLCQAISLLLVRTTATEKLFTPRLWGNKKLLTSFAAALLLFLGLSYIPWLQSFFGTEALGWSDWFWTLAASLIYLVARMLQRHTRKHSRHAVLSLHKQITHSKQS